MTNLLLLLFSLFQGRYYWPVNIDDMAAGRNQHTHVQIVGIVTLVRHELDGDTHIKVVGKIGFVIAECIPALPCAKPVVGQRVTVQGIARFDGEHKWYEVHPVESIK